MSIDEKLYNLLSEGAENAISAAELQRLLGLDFRQDVNELVHRMRKDGQVILSNNKGYYLPACDAETAAFVRSMDSRAEAIKAATESARRACEVLTDD
ncbi:MAG: hypothetical protein II574_06570 [Ruminococcus sp.]|nr:hypothetical protein [Ruminococcus sp.]